MESVSGAAPRPERLNVLTLDGGGVRGLSTLLILQDLMAQINVSLRALRGSEHPHSDVQPHDIFDLVAGTSTGGLIAVMLGKLGMTIEQCITAYRDLSQTIFGTKQIGGRLTFGLATSKYSGSRLRKAVCKLLGKHGFSPDLPMTYVAGKDKIACAVVCREHENESRYSDFKSDPVPICSLPCSEAVVCLVCDAARATSAAPTYFRVQKIAGRSFVDGGMEFNNPSYAIFDHYTQLGRVAESRRTSTAAQAGSVAPNHGNLDFARIRIVNLGTGTKPPSTGGHTPSIMASLTPPAFRMAAFLRKTLTQMAVNSENTAKHMESIARVSRGTGSCDVHYSRFSANNGVCYIKLDEFSKLELITTLTQAYLALPEIQQNIQRLAVDMAKDYLKRHSVVHSTVLNVPSWTTPHAPDSFVQQSQVSTSQNFQNSETNTTRESGVGTTLTKNASTLSNSTITTEASAEPTTLPHAPTPVIPARQMPDITGAADSMIGPDPTGVTIAPVRS